MTELNADHVVARIWEWVDSNAHYCPHCPEGLREEVVLAAELEAFIETLQIDGAIRREQALFDAEDDDEVAAAEWVPNRTHIDGEESG